MNLFWEHEDLAIYAIQQKLTRSFSNPEKSIST